MTLQNPSSEHSDVDFIIAIIRLGVLSPIRCTELAQGPIVMQAQ